MPQRRLARLAVASAVATAILAATALQAGATSPPPTTPVLPDASVSSRSSTPLTAARGPRGTSGHLGSGARPKGRPVPGVGPFSGPVFGGPIAPDPLAQSLIGFDTRSQLFDTTNGPARMTALITNNGNQWCTGFLIGPSTLITAGHCLHPGGVGQTWYPVSALRVYPGYNADAAVTAPFGSCGAVALFSTTAWMSSNDDQYDYGAIKLDCTIGNQTGWFGWWWQPKSLDGQITKIFGYPGDKAAEPWKSKDYVRVTEGRRVFYANDTAGGNSGSPVFRYRGGTEIGCQGNCVMAIHAYGTYGAWPYSAYNHGARVTQEVSDNFFLWRNS